MNEHPLLYKTVDISTTTPIFRKDVRAYSQYTLTEALDN